MTDARDRAYGALLGLALGDALGMPTQLLTLDQVRGRYGLVDRFHPGPIDHPIAAGLPAGRVTDDTDQALIVGRLLVAGAGRVEPSALVDALGAWQARMVAAGSSDLLGPSTTAALDAIAAGADPATAGRSGATNGAAMRIAPVGLAYAPEPLADLVDVVAEVSRPTHGTAVAIAGAAAVAAAVSVGVAGGSVDDVIAMAVRAATEGARRGVRDREVDLGRRITDAMRLVSGTDVDGVLDVVDRAVGTSMATEESVPAAFAVVARFGADPWAAVGHAASLGGDSDTIAAMVGAITGACHGASAFPLDAVAEFESVNPDLGVADLADRLVMIGRRSRPRT